MPYRIYQIINAVNSLLYVGHTQDEIQQRFRSHIRDSKAKSSRSFNAPLHVAMRQYGVENFAISLLEEGHEEYHKILERERYWMLQLNSMHPHGYNIFCPKLSNEDAAIVRYNAYNLMGTEYANLFGLSVAAIYQIRANKPGTPYKHSDRSSLPEDIIAYATRMGHLATIKKMRGEDF